MRTGARAKAQESHGTEHETPVDGNVFADIGFPPDEAENLMVRSQLMSAVDDRIAGMTQAAAATLLGVSQPRVSDLVRGKIGNFTIDALVNMLGSAGVRVWIVTRPAQVTAVREQPPVYQVKRKRAKPRKAKVRKKV